MVPRGIIITPIYTTQQITLIDARYLRKCLLYWDMIDCPDDATTHLSPLSDPNDLALLQSEGIFQRTSGYFFKKVSNDYILSFCLEHPYEFWSLAQSYALKKHDNVNEHWVIGQVGKRSEFLEPVAASNFAFVDSKGVGPNSPANILRLPSEKIYDQSSNFELGPALRIELENFLPVPHSEVPVEKIIQFKRKRWDELLRFRHTLDKLYLSIIGSNDVSATKEYAMDEVVQSLNDLNKVMSESKLRRIFSTIRVELTINDVVLGAVIGNAIGSMWGWPLVGATIGALTPALKVALDSSLLRPKHQILSEFKDYAYLYHAEEEVDASL